MPADDEGLQEPVSRDLRALLRRAVLEHAASERRRQFLPLVRVGRPGGAQAVFASPADQLPDHALRADVVAAMLRRTRTAEGEPLVWLTRRGDLDLQDVDAAWLAAARTAYAEAGVRLTMVVVNRRGWRDPRSGLEQVWSRVRG